MAKLSLALSNSESVRSCCLSMRCSLSVISAFCSSRSCTISWRSLVSLGDDDIMMILWWCYDGVMMTLWWRYDDVMMTLWCSQFLVKIDRGWWWRSIYLGKSMMTCTERYFCDVQEQMGDWPVDGSAHLLSGLVQIVLQILLLFICPHC